jgi:surface polysaccharide O-acyltransferase-like enzyme
MEKLKIRKSNLEILRIVSMILIIIHHYVVHGGFEWETVTINKIVLDVLTLGGKLGVNCFVLITGYFMIESKINFKKVGKIVLEVLFYSVSIYISFVFLGFINFDTKLFIKHIFPVIHDIYWFATAYVFLYLLSPFINQLINSITQKQHRYLCLMLIVIFCIIPTIIEYDVEYSNLSWFVTLYLIAAYIRKYPNKHTETLKDNLIYTGIIISIMIFFIVEVNFIALLIPRVGIYISYCAKANSIGILSLAIMMFLSFKNMNIKNSKWVNKIASSTFGVYLIHDNQLIRNYLWVKLLKGNTYAKSPYLIVHLICSIIFVFVICSVIDQIRIYIVEKNFVDKILDKIYNLYECKAKLKNEKIRLDKQKVLQQKGEI